MINTLAQDTAKQYAKLSGNAEAALDPATIMAFAELIIQIIAKIKECKQAQEGAAAIQNPNLFQKLLLRRWVKQDISPNEFRKHGEHIVQALIATGYELSTEQVQGLYEQV